MVTSHKLLASLGDYRRVYTHICGYPTSTEGLDTRNRMRFNILDHRRQLQTLSVPVAGGAKALKSPHSNPAISAHGRWWPVMEGTLNAAYASAPYFTHLYPEICSIFSHAYALAEGGEVVTSATLIAQCSDLVDKWLGANLTPESIQQFRATHSTLLHEYRTRLTTEYPDADSLSIIHYLMHYGPETLFLML